MRALLVGLIALAAAACAETVVSNGVVRTTLPSTARSEWPFPQAPRGSAVAPPTATASSTAAPPEGRGPGGIDFGQWKSADPAVYGPAFQTQVRQRYAGQSLAQMQADLQRNGFTCAQSGTPMQCRLEIMERQCAFDWYVVVERSNAEPVAGFDLMCLGAR